MKDIVDLRQAANILRDKQEYVAALIIDKCADEIARLRAENEQLKGDGR